MTLKEQIEAVIDHPAIAEKFKAVERAKLEICNECPDKDECWGCGNEPRKWWLE